MDPHSSPPLHRPPVGADVVMDSYPVHGRASYASPPPHHLYSQPRQQPHVYSQQTIPRTYSREDYPRTSYHPSSHPHSQSYPYPPIGNAYQPQSQVSPHAVPAPYQSQPQRATPLSPVQEPQHAYHMASSQHPYPSSAQQGAPVGPASNFQYRSTSQPRSPPRYHHGSPAHPRHQSPSTYGNVPYTHPAAASVYPMAAQGHQQIPSSQPPTNYPAPQPFQPPFNPPVPQSQMRFSLVQPPAQFTAHQPAQPQPQPTFTSHQLQQPSSCNPSQLTQTQSFTSLDGWYAYDPEETRHKPSRKKTSKKPAPATKSASSTTAQSKMHKQVRISESAPAKSGDRSPRHGDTVTPSCPATASSSLPDVIPMPISMPPAASARLDPTSSSATLNSAHASAVNATPPTTPGWLPKRGKLPPPDGQIPLRFTSEKTLNDKLELWGALPEADQRRLRAMFFESRSRTAAFTVGSAAQVPPSPGQELNHAASSSHEYRDGGKGKEKEKEKEETRKRKGKEKEKEEPPPKPTNATRSWPSGAATYKAPTVEEVPEQSDGGLSYASDAAPHHSDECRSSPTHETVNCLQGTSQTFPVSSESHYGSNHMTVKILDMFHRQEEHMHRIEGTMATLVNAFGHSGRPAGRAQPFTRRARPGTFHLASRSHASSRRRSDGSDADDVGDDGDEEVQDESDDDEGDDDGENDNLEAEERASQELKAQADAQNEKDKPHRTRLAQIVRKYMDLRLLKFSHTSELPAKFPRLTDKELSDYRANKYPPFSEKHFRICFVREWARCPWNAGAREFVMDALIDICQRKAFTGVLEGPPLPRRFYTRKAMTKAVNSHVYYLRGEYKDHAGPLTSAKEKKLKKHKKNAGINRRKGTTLRARERTVNRHGLLRHVTLFKKLQPRHMSGDEAAAEKEDGAPGPSGQAYHIIEAAWQGREFKTCMRDLDVWNLRDFGDHTSGSKPRRRVALEKPRVVDSAAPEGLWRNCYNPRWLKKLDPHQRRQLNIIDEDFDFTLPVYEEVTIVNAAKEFPPEDEEGANGDDEDEGEDEDEDEDEDEREEN